MCVTMKVENSNLVCLYCNTVLDDITLASMEKGQGEKISVCAVMTMTCPKCHKNWRQTVISEEV